MEQELKFKVLRNLTKIIEPDPDEATVTQQWLDGSLTRILPDNFEVDGELYIRNRAFEGLPELNYVMLPRNVYLGNSVFSNCQNLTEISTRCTMSEVYDRWNEDWANESNITVVHCSNGDIPIGG